MDKTIKKKKLLNIASKTNLKYHTHTKKKKKNEMKGFTSQFILIYMSCLMIIGKRKIENGLYIQADLPHLVTF